MSFNEDDVIDARVLEQVEMFLSSVPVIPKGVLLEYLGILNKMSDTLEAHIQEHGRGLIADVAHHICVASLHIYRASERRTDTPQRRRDLMLARIELLTARMYLPD